MHRTFKKSMTYTEYLKYLFPSVVSMIFLSFYTTVDGFFVSRFINSNALAAINILIPLTCVFFGISIMLATGAGAIVGIRHGEGRSHEGDQFFSFVVVMLLAIIFLLTVLGLIFLNPILTFSGSTDILRPYTSVYGFWMVSMIPAMMLKLFFEYFARIGGHPKVSMVMSVSGLILNIIFDTLFIVYLDMGIAGAGLGTALAMYLSAFIGVIHFLRGKSAIKLVRPKIELKAFFRSCYNGSSEMMTEISTGITTLLFNLILLKHAGESGVAAMSILTYFYYFFTAVFFGITVAAQPIISYNLGARVKSKLHEIMRYSFCTLMWTSFLIVGIAFIFATPLVKFFSPEPEVVSIAVSGLKIFCATFLMCGINIFISGYFTAIGKGGLSAIVSFCRSLIFIVIYLSIFPNIFGISGVWISTPLAELTTLVIAISFYLIFNVHSDRNFKKLSGGYS